MPNISAGTRRDEAIRKLEPARDERYKWLAPFGPVRHADEQERKIARERGVRHIDAESAQARIITEPVAQREAGKLGQPAENVANLTPK